jgi:hypothetical protein
MKEEEEARESLSETKRNVKEKVFIAWLKKMRCEHGDEEGIREWEEQEENQAVRNGGIMRGSENSQW